MYTVQCVRQVFLVTLWLENQMLHFCFMLAFGKFSLNIRCLGQNFKSLEKIIFAVLCMSTNSDQGVFWVI